LSFALAERERERKKVEKKSDSRGARYPRPFLEMNARSRNSISLDEEIQVFSIADADQRFAAISQFFSYSANQPRTQLWRKRNDCFDLDSIAAL